MRVALPAVDAPRGLEELKSVKNTVSPPPGAANTGAIIDNRCIACRRAPEDRATGANDFEEAFEGCEAA